MDLYRRVRKIFCAPAVTAVVFFSSTLASLLPSEKKLLNYGEEKYWKGQKKKCESSIKK
jgi:hypothetical protein